MTRRLVALGASSGGVQAVQKILAALPTEFPVPLVVVQHLPSEGGLGLEKTYSHHFHGRVVEARDKTPLLPGHAYLAPPGYHLLMESDGALALSADDPVHFSRPSIDVFFESLARHCGRETVGVLLTGASEDGAAGLFAIHRAGGTTVVQDPADADMPVMPEAALGRFKPDHVLHLRDIPAILQELAAGGAA